VDCHKLQRSLDILEGTSKDISQFAIWGNHSATHIPSLAHTVIDGKPALECVTSEWYKTDFTPAVQKRGATVIAARGSSSAASAASSLIDAVKDWNFGHYPEWTSAGVCSSGEYGVDKGLFFSYPVTFLDKRWDIVKDLPLDEYSGKMIQDTLTELRGERDAISKFLPS